MKLSKEELSKKINELDGLDDAKKIELLEDIADSMDFDTSELDGKIEELTNQLADITAKYKERFLSSDKKEDETEEKEDEELEEKEVVDVKEI